MKRQLTLIAALVLSCTMAMAKGKGEQRDLKYFNHFSVGLELGTTGFGAEIAAPMTQYVTFRTGFTMVPVISPEFDIDGVEFSNNKELDLKVQAKLHMLDWKFLADIYPFRNSSFHVTGGFYLGKSKLITAENTTPIKVGYAPTDDLLPGEGLEIDNGTLVCPDANGIIRANAKIRGFKPYVGIGFGRPVAKSKKLVTCAFDLGVQFWGTPTLNVWSPDDNRWARVRKNDFDDDTFQDVYKIVNKVTVYPVLNFRLYFNAFNHK